MSANAPFKGYYLKAQIFNEHVHFYFPLLNGQKTKSIHQQLSLLIPSIAAHNKMKLKHKGRLILENP
jgi:hypothetical protein